MVDILSVTAKIRQGKRKKRKIEEKEDRRNHRAKI